MRPTATPFAAGTWGVPATRGVRAIRAMSAARRAGRATGFARVGCKTATTARRVWELRSGTGRVRPRPLGSALITLPGSLAGVAFQPLVRLPLPALTSARVAAVSIGGQRRRHIRHRQMVSRFRPRPTATTVQERADPAALLGHTAAGRVRKDACRRRSDRGPDEASELGSRDGRGWSAEPALHTQLTDSARGRVRPAYGDLQVTFRLASQSSAALLLIVLKEQCTSCRDDRIRAIVIVTVIAWTACRSLAAEVTS
jgi:hypothetical protein